MSVDQFVFLDFETTGLDPDVCRVIEIGAIRMDVEGVEYARYNCLVDIGVPLSDSIINFTGITDAQLRDNGISSKEAFEKLTAFIGETNCAAFNAEFDEKFLRAELLRNNLPLMNNTFHCALEMARRAWPVFRSHNLSALCNFFELETVRHRALADAIAGSVVFLKAANSIWHNRITNSFVVGRYYVSKIDIENFFGCKNGTKLKLWTKPELDFVNAYVPGSVGNQGLALVLPKEQNSELLKEIADGSVKYLLVEREGHSSFSLDGVP